VAGVDLRQLGRGPWRAARLAQRRPGLGLRLLAVLGGSRLPGRGVSEAGLLLK